MKTRNKIATVAVACTALLCLGWEEKIWTFTTNNGVAVVAGFVQTNQPNPTQHFDWMPKLYPDDYNEPEWNYIRFGNNHVPWLTFRRGAFGNYWNGWLPLPATERNAVILQSSFEPVATKTNGVWIITFKR